MERAFSPMAIGGKASRAVGPGWYEIAPLVLGNWGGSGSIRFDGCSPDVAFLQQITRELHGSPR